MKKMITGQRKQEESLSEEEKNLSKAAPGNKAGSSSGVLADLILFLFKIVLIALFFVILFTFIFGITQVRDNSMAPAVREGDLVIYYRFQKDYAAQDVIALNENGQAQVRRVIAVAGDDVNLTENGLELNGYPQIESNIYTETLPYVEGITFPVTLGEGQIFVLGDNRTESRDSRIYGPISTNATLGKVVTVIRRRGF